MATQRLAVAQLLQHSRQRREWCKASQVSYLQSDRHATSTRRPVFTPFGLNHMFDR